jgi:glycoprotein endo-alpha-1,2-mannosidase
MKADLRCRAWTPTASWVVIVSFIFFWATSVSVRNTNAQEQNEEKALIESLTVGAYYYPWYRSGDSRRGGRSEIGWMSQALRGRLTPRQLRKLGVYDSRDPKVIGDHIAQSLRAGIDLWAVSWWGPGDRGDKTFRDHILKHPDAAKLKYAALYESTGRLGSFDKPDYSNLIGDFEYLREHYFEHPSYLKMDGKPVVFVYLTRVYFRNQGLGALAELREAFPNLYLIGDEVFGGRYREEYAEIWDAITAYDVYGQSVQIDGATQAGVNRLRENYANAKKLAGKSGSAFIPGIAPGYNDRAVRKGHAGRPRYFTDQDGSREGDLFRAMIRDVAVPLADSRTNRTVMVTSFNEWYEDTQIEATLGEAETTSKDDSNTGKFYTEGDRYVDYGPLYLDILKKEKEASLRLDAADLSVLFRDNEVAGEV